jgi:hypothetical protein
MIRMCNRTLQSWNIYSTAQRWDLNPWYPDNGSCVLLPCQKDTATFPTELYKIENLCQSAPLNWTEKIIIFALFKSRTALVWISPFNLKMDEITRAGRLWTKPNNFILLDYHLSKKNLILAWLNTKISHLSFVYY